MSRGQPWQVKEQAMNIPRWKKTAKEKLRKEAKLLEWNSAKSNKELAKYTWKTTGEESQEKKKSPNH